MEKMDYSLLDSGAGEKLERFGNYTLIRPCSQAIWSKDKNKARLWEEAHASFNRKGGLNWRGRDNLPNQWVIQINSVKMKLSTTDFGHLGIFPETIKLWEAIQEKIQPLILENRSRLNFLIYLPTLEVRQWLQLMLEHTAVMLMLLKAWCNGLETMLRSMV